MDKKNTGDRWCRTTVGWTSLSRVWCLQTATCTWWHWSCVGLGSCTAPCQLCKLRLHGDTESSWPQWELPIYPFQGNSWKQWHVGWWPRASPIPTWGPEISSGSTPTLCPPCRKNSCFRMGVMTEEPVMTVLHFLLLPPPSCLTNPGIRPSSTMSSKMPPSW